MPDPLRETFEAYALRAPVADGLRDAVGTRIRRDRARRRWYAAAAALLPLTAVAAYFALGVDTRPEPAVPRPVAERPAPPGMRWVMRGGVEVAAPVEWFAPTFDACGNARSDAVVLNNPPSTGDCALYPTPHVNELILSSARQWNIPEMRTRSEVANEAVTIDGVAAERLTTRNELGQHVGAIVVESRDVAILLRSDDADVVRRVLDTVRVSHGRDSRGCEIAIESPYAREPAEREEAREEMVPGTPVQASVCRYGGRTPTLSASALLGPDDTARLARALNVGPHVVGGRPVLDLRSPTPVIVTFRYATGPDVVVYLHHDADQMSGASNGSVTGPAGTQAQDIVRPLVGWRYFTYDEKTVKFVA